MENDGIYGRVNINSVIKELKKKNLDISEFEYKMLAYKMISELSKEVKGIISEFEKGEGFFDSSFFSAKEELDL